MHKYLSGLLIGICYAHVSGLLGMESQQYQLPYAHQDYTYYTAIEESQRENLRDYVVKYGRNNKLRINQLYESLGKVAHSLNYFHETEGSMDKQSSREHVHQLRDNYTFLSQHASVDNIDLLCKGWLAPGVDTSPNRITTLINPQKEALEDYMMEYGFNKSLRISQLYASLWKIAKSLNHFHKMEGCMDRISTAEHVRHVDQLRKGHAFLSQHASVDNIDLLCKGWLMPGVDASSRRINMLINPQFKHLLEFQDIYLRVCLKDVLKDTKRSKNKHK